jgi:hypothetical protein
MKRIFQILKRLRTPLYELIYQKEDIQEVERYIIKNFKLRSEYGNQKDGITIKGCRAFCVSRNAVRSFNYKGIKSITRLLPWEKY